MLEYRSIPEERPLSVEGSNLARCLADSIKWLFWKRKY
jgi:hypothetical protein